MLLFGRVSNRIDPRLLIFVGLSTVGWTMYAMSGWSLEIGAKQFIELGLIQGFGMGLSFVPMTTLAFSTLPSVCGPKPQDSMRSSAMSEAQSAFRS